MSSDDPIEHVGTSSKGERADPVPSKRKVAPPVAVIAPLAEELAEPTKPNTHKKFAVVRPAKEYEAAQQETRDAQAEQVLANRELADAEKDESRALGVWLSLQPKVSADDLLMDYAKNSVAQRAANVAAGLPPEGVRTPTHGNSLVDRAAANRQRQSPQMATAAPLRSPVPRRIA